MSESLTINTLNQGHFTHTQAHPYNHTHRIGWDQMVGVREGEPQEKKKWENPIQSPSGWGKRAELLLWACLQSRGRVIVIHFGIPRRVRLDTQ